MRLKGFTLIELMVVVSIVGILAMVGTSSYNSIQKKAKMAKRLSDMAEVKKALESYKSVNGIYPYDDSTAAGMDWRSQCNSWGGFSNNQVIPTKTGYPAFVPNYMSTLPIDPDMNTSTNLFCYIYKSADGKNFKFLAHNIYLPSLGERQANYRSYPDFIDPARDNCAASPGDTSIVDYNYSITQGASDTCIWSFAVYTPGAANW